MAELEGSPVPGGGCGPGGPGGMNGKDTGIDSNSAKPGFMGLFRKKRYIARPRMSSRAEGGCPGVCGSPGRPGNPGSPGPDISGTGSERQGES